MSSSTRREINQTILETVLAAVLYFDSVEDLLTTFCFEQDHDTKFVSKINTKITSTSSINR